jgi:hypothetical protein
VRVWVEDFKYHLAMALRAVGIGIVAVAWASALASEAQQVTDTRAYAEVGAAVVCLLIVHLFTRLPPSWTVTDLLKPLDRDIVAVARERSGGDARLQAESAAAIRALATERIRNGANVPRDRRAWVRGLSRLAEADQARDDLEMGQSGDT